MLLFLHPLVDNVTFALLNAPGARVHFASIAMAA